MYIIGLAALVVIAPNCPNCPPLCGLCDAVAPSKSSNIAGTRGYAYGWGADEDGNHDVSATQLGGMDIVTLPCAEFDNDQEGPQSGRINVTDVWENSRAPKFICSAPDTHVGLCTGDSGGKLIKARSPYVHLILARNRAPRMNHPALLYICLYMSVYIQTSLYAGLKSMHALH